MSQGCFLERVPRLFLSDRIGTGPTRVGPVLTSSQLRGITLLE